MKFWRIWSRSSDFAEISRGNVDGSMAKASCLGNDLGLTAWQA